MNLNVYLSEEVYNMLVQHRRECPHCVNDSQVVQHAIKIARARDYERYIKQREEEEEEEIKGSGASGECME